MTFDNKAYQREWRKRPENMAADRARYCGDRKQRQLDRQRSPEYQAAQKAQRATREGKARCAGWRLKLSGVPLPPKDGACECCETKVGWQKLHCDHDHETHRFRAWLCYGCNTGIGIKDDPALLAKRLAMLERTR